MQPATIRLIHIKRGWIRRLRLDRGATGWLGCGTLSDTGARVMRAAVFETAGQPLVIRDDVEIIAPRAGEVRVRVHCQACATRTTALSPAASRSWAR